MPHAHVSPRRSALRRAFTQAFVLSLLPLGSAFARRTSRSLSCESPTTRPRSRLCAGRRNAHEGTQGNRPGGHLHRRRPLVAPEFELVLGAAPARSLGHPARGWIRGDAVEHVSPPEPAPAPRRASRRAAGACKRDRAAQRRCRGAAPVEDVPAAEPVIFSDVVLNFQFGRSELTEEAKRKLASAITTPKPNARLFRRARRTRRLDGSRGLQRAARAGSRRIRAAVPGRPAPDSGRTDQRGQLRRGQPGGPEHHP